MDESPSRPLIDMESVDLIDLSTPRQHRTAPLISCPPLVNIIIDDNPFDLIANQADSNLIETDDPFEIVFKTAFSKVENTCEEGVRPQLQEKSEDNVRESCVESGDSLGEVEDASQKPDTLNPCQNDLKSGTDVLTVEPNDSIPNEQTNNLNSDSKPTSPISEAGSSTISLDFSNEETIRKSIARRINTFIQKTLNSTSEKINQVAEDEVDEFTEAKNLNNTFKEIAQSFCDTNESEESILQVKIKLADSSDEEMDLLRNDPALNLRFTSKSLEQLDCSSQKKPIKFSEAVENYRRRRSIELNSSLNSSSDAVGITELKRSYSFNGLETNIKKVVMGDSKDIISATECLMKKQAGPLPVQHEDISQKLKMKKPQPEIVKKGPMKAVIPLQNMARIDPIKVQRTFSKKIVKNTQEKQRPRSAGHVVNNQSPSKKNSTKPVAASTPNKGSALPIVSPATSPIESDRKHHSLDSGEQLQKYGMKRRSASFTGFSPAERKENVRPTASFNFENKKMASPQSQLPKVSALASRNANQLANVHGKPTGIPQHSPLRKVDKFPSKISFNRRRLMGNEKENNVM